MAKDIKFKNLGDGLKGINFEAFGGIDNFLNLTAGGGTQKASLLRRVVPWLAKANSMTANAISELPFDLMKDGEVYDTSEEWQNNLGGIPNPKRLIRQIASSLCYGKAYVIPTVTNIQIVELHYCATHTVNPMITTKGLVSFSRTSDFGQAGQYVPAGENVGTYSGEMIYFWLPDSDIEIGPAKTYPMGAAMLSTELLVNMDATLKTISEHGFIPATILAAKGMPKEGERDKTEAWWNRFLRGWTDTVAKIINAETMDIKQVGAGLDALRTVYRDLTRQQIENIGASHGIPGALFMSDMAFASEFNAMIKFWYSTSEFINIYNCIEETFNEQLFNRFGINMEFHPETLDAYQEDENQRANAFRSYVSARIRPSIVGEMLGLDLPEGIEYSALDEDFDKPEPVKPINPLNNPDAPMPQEQMPNMNASNTTIPQPPQFAGVEMKWVQLDAQQIKDLDLWRQVAVRNHGKRKGNAVDFKCESLPDYIANPIRERLKNAKNELDIVKAFEIYGDQSDSVLSTLESALKMVMDGKP